ncbi:hypothetical protein MiSe_78290 [Microseira wollei NIES-4236]|uniref:Uncharacterized protein n=2 Tax=Microseira wollei TaxID=467598 RepID=A0AAV3XKK8_9CYAN|nr:hypothetical protein MiSe_78290 [Microseira wollei NIES-4236]
MQYILRAMGTNSAQETRSDIQESLELLEQLRARFAAFESVPQSKNPRRRAWPRNSQCRPHIRLLQQTNYPGIAWGKIEFYLAKNESTERIHRKATIRNPTVSGTKLRAGSS